MTKNSIIYFCFFLLANVTLVLCQDNQQKNRGDANGSNGDSFTDTLLHPFKVAAQYFTMVAKSSYLAIFGSGRKIKQKTDGEKYSTDEKNENLNGENNSGKEAVTNSGSVTGPCAKQPCGDKGVCTDLGRNSSYLCTCEKDWGDDLDYQRPNCKKHFQSVCLDSLCEHGGECPREATEDGSCQCRKGYTGRFCEHGSNSKWVPSTSRWIYNKKFIVIASIGGPIFLSCLILSCIIMLKMNQLFNKTQESFQKHRQHRRHHRRHHREAVTPLVSISEPEMSHQSPSGSPRKHHKSHRHHHSTNKLRSSNHEERHLLSPPPFSEKELSTSSGSESGMTYPPFLFN